MMRDDLNWRESNYISSPSCCGAHVAQRSAYTLWGSWCKGWWGCGRNVRRPLMWDRAP